MLSYSADQEIRKSRVAMERKCVCTNTYHGTHFSASLMYSIVLHRKMGFNRTFPSTNFQVRHPYCVVWNYKYKQYIIKHNSINDFIKAYFLHCFVQFVLPTPHYNTL